MATIHSDEIPSPSVLLVSLPWTSLTEPSLGLGILRAVLDERRIPCRVLHLNLFLLEHLRAPTYYALANIFALNDFMFSAVLDPKISRKQEQWLRMKAEELLTYKLIDERQYGGLDGVIQQLLRLRQEVIPNWLVRWADEIGRSDATLVGFTCMFDQTIASVALAHLLKQRVPNKMVALGGYAVRSPTGEAVLRSFSCVDAVCTGEGEPVILPLAYASTGQLSLSEIHGILYRRPDGGVCSTAPAASMYMNLIPAPNYDDFFADLKNLSEVHHIEIEVDRLPIENSRGCWWGQVKHCVFCGIHDEDMTYRSREASRVLEVMDCLASRYGLHSFRFSDYILPHQYYRTLLPEMALRGKPYRITCEMKANVSAQRFELLAAAGFDEVQPGIESFSSSVLRKMDKGVSAIQNVHTLLLGKRHGIMVHYNVLYGLPDEEEQEYEAIVNTLPRFFHLDPPSTRLLVQITRYAPLHTNPQRFGIAPACHDPSYGMIFSQDFLNVKGFDLDDFCYYFERSFENSPQLNRLYRKIDHLVDEWKSIQAQRQVCLWYEVKADGLEIFDSRSGSPVASHLDQIEAFVYQTTFEPISVERLWQRCTTLMERGELDEILQRLDRQSLLFRDNEQVIGLALPREVYAHQGNQFSFSQIGRQNEALPREKA